MIIYQLKKIILFLQSLDKHLNIFLKIIKKNLQVHNVLI